MEERLVPSSTITGRVFEDYNENGLYDTATTISNDQTGTIGAANETNSAPPVATGASGIRVRAFDAAGNNVTPGAGQFVTLASDGTFSFATTDAGTGPYRVEFTNLPAGFVEGPTGPTATASASHTAVQFLPAGGPYSNVNLGIVQSLDQVPLTRTIGAITSPNMLVNYATQGNYNGVNGTKTVITDIPYSAGTVNSDTTNSRYSDALATHFIAIQNQYVGTTNGLAFNPFMRASGSLGTIYAAAYAKMFSDYGPNGTGAIYMTDFLSTASAASPITGAAGAGNTRLFADLNLIDPNGAGPNTHDVQAISTATHSGATVTLTLASAANYVTGQTVTVSGVGVAAYNGTFTITAVNTGANTITYTALSTPASNSSGGSAYNAAADTDADMWDRVGKTSLGSMVLSEDGKTLYVVNLYDNTLWALGVNPDGSYSGVARSTPLPSAIGAAAWQATVTGTSAANTITAASEVGNTVTITTSGANGFKVGQTVQISGVGAGYDGTVVITAVNVGANQFSYKSATSGLSPASSGTAQDVYGDLKPFVVRLYNDKLYVGAVNTAESTYLGTFNITAGGATHVGTTVTITTAAATGIKVGDTVHIDGVGVAGYDGIWTVTTVNTALNQFTYTVGTAPASNSGGGKVTDMGNRNALNAYIFTASDSGGTLSFDANPFPSRPVGSAGTTSTTIAVLGTAVSRRQPSAPGIPGPRHKIPLSEAGSRAAARSIPNRC
jgi:hypothetical protein